jgi:hypothetical protein
MERAVASGRLLRLLSDRISRRGRAAYYSGRRRTASPSATTTETVCCPAKQVRQLSLNIGAIQAALHSTFRLIPIQSTEYPP